MQILFAYLLISFIFLLRQNASGINLSNIRQSGRVRKTVDYTFSEFDQEISDAVDRDGRGKRCGEIQQAITATRGTRQSKRRRMLYSESDSDSNYDPGSPVVEPQIPKHPERHVYLRRHENGVENGTIDNDKVVKENYLEGDNEDANNDTVCNKDFVEYKNINDKNSNTGGESNSQSSDSSLMRDNINKMTTQNPEDLNCVNTIIKTEDIDAVAISKVSERGLDAVNTDSNQTNNINSVYKLNNQPPEELKCPANMSIRPDDSSIRNRVEHCSVKANNIVYDQDKLSTSLLGEDTLTSSDVKEQISTEKITNEDNVNGENFTTAESNCNILLNSRDIDLVTIVSNLNGEQPTA